MIQAQKYNGGLTSEQFLFYEIRIAVKFYLDGKSVDEAVSLIKQDNLFQYPTERKISKMTRVCYRRLDALDNRTLVEELANAPAEIAKQINLLTQENLLLPKPTSSPSQGWMTGA